MFIAYCVLALVYSAMLTFSGISKLQPHPEAVKMIHEVIGVPMAMFPVLAALEFAAAAGAAGGNPLGTPGRRGGRRRDAVFHRRDRQSPARWRLRRDRWRRVHAGVRLHTPRPQDEDAGPAAHSLT